MMMMTWKPHTTAQHQPQETEWNATSKGIDTLIKNNSNGWRMAELTKKIANSFVIHNCSVFLKTLF